MEEKYELIDEAGFFKYCGHSSLEEILADPSISEEEYELWRWQWYILERAEVYDVQLKDEAAFFKYFGYSSREDFLNDFLSAASPCLAEKEYALARELWHILERVEPFSESEANGLDESAHICDIIDASLEYGHISREMYDRLMYIYDITENPLFGRLFDLISCDFSFFEGFSN